MVKPQQHHNNLCWDFSFRHIFSKIHYKFSLFYFDLLKYHCGQVPFGGKKCYNSLSLFAAIRFSWKWTISAVKSIYIFMQCCTLVIVVGFVVAVELSITDVWFCSTVFFVWFGELPSDSTVCLSFCSFMWWFVLSCLCICGQYLWLLCPHGFGVSAVVLITAHSLLCMFVAKKNHLSDVKEKY